MRWLELSHLQCPSTRCGQVRWSLTGPAGQPRRPASSPAASGAAVARVPSASCHPAVGGQSCSARRGRSGFGPAAGRRLWEVSCWRGGPPSE